MPKASNDKQKDDTAKKERGAAKQTVKGRRSSVAETASKLLNTPAQILGPRLMFILAVVALCILGLVMVYSASSIMAHNDVSVTGGDSAYYLKRQAIFLFVGVIACVVLAKIPYNVWGKLPVFVALWLIAVLMLAATAFGLGVAALGAARSIMIGPFALQPAEFAKIAVVIAVAALLASQRENPMSFRRFVVLIIFAIVVPIALIYRQPDLGTAIILAVGILAVLLLTGVPMGIILGIVGILIAYVVFVCIAQPYHIDRIVSMFDPWLDPLGDGYQSIQSLYAFGSGGIFGTGLGLSRQKYLYLPYAHTDFIFAVIGEELGLIGAAITAGLFGLFILGGMRICRNAPDLFGCALAGGMTTMIGFQACVNMMCVIGIAPVTGKALPFISYGGSSIVATMIMVGIVLSVSFQSRVGVQHEKRRDDLLVFDGGNAAGKAKEAGGEAMGRAAALGLSILQGKNNKADQKASSSRKGSSRKDDSKRNTGRGSSSKGSTSSRSSRTGSKSAPSTRRKSSSGSSTRSRSASTKKGKQSGYASVRPMSKGTGSASRSSSSRTSRAGSGSRMNNVTYIGSGSRTSQRTASSSRNGSGSRTTSSSRGTSSTRRGTSSRTGGSQRSTQNTSRGTQRSASRNSRAGGASTRNNNATQSGSDRKTKGSSRLNYHDANRRPGTNSSSRSRRKR